MFTPSSSTSNRILALDALRGFALFGVLVTNIFLFNAYSGDLANYLSQFPDKIDQGAGSVIRYFFRGRFYPIFSLLFGLGMGMQYLRAAEAGHGTSLLLKRLLLLLVIGVLHYVLVWDGDILVRYALLGFVALAFLKRSSSTILSFSLLLYLLHCVYAAALSTSFEVEGAGINLLEENIVWLDYPMLTLARSYGLPASYSSVNSLFYSIRILSFILLGLYFSKRHFFDKHSSNQRVWLPALALLASTRAVIAGVTMLTPHAADVWLSFLSYVLTPAIYVCAFMALVQLKWLQQITGLLAAAGRMSLTNYVMQNVILSYVFYGYGLAQYQQWQPWQLIAFAAILFMLQGLASLWWLRQYGQGPLEKIWRELAATKVKRRHEVY